MTVKEIREALRPRPQGFMLCSYHIQMHNSLVGAEPWLCHPHTKLDRKLDLQSIGTSPKRHLELNPILQLQ